MLHGQVETPRLILRKFRHDDTLEMFSNWASDIEVTKYLTWLPHTNVDTVQALIDMWVEEYKDPNVLRYGITLKSSGALIGGIDIVEIRNGIPYIGYVLSRKHWNNGYMSEACKAFLDCLKDAGYQEAGIEAHVDNIASNRVIEKCGFVFDHQDYRPQSAVKPETILTNCYRIVLK